MTPQDFLVFRAELEPASGFQSVQFREIEFLSGLKDPRYLERVHTTDMRRAGPARTPARGAVAVGRVPLAARADGRPRPHRGAARPGRYGRCSTCPRTSSTTTRRSRSGGCGTSRWSSARSAASRGRAARPGRHTCAAPSTAGSSPSSGPSATASEVVLASCRRGTSRPRPARRDRGGASRGRCQPDRLGLGIEDDRDDDRHGEARDRHRDHPDVGVGHDRPHDDDREEEPERHDHVDGGAPQREALVADEAQATPRAPLLHREERA